jgi:para-aminobenzoate synthetase component 1
MAPFPKNFYFKPDGPDSTKGLVYPLEPSEIPLNDGFVIVPYKDPATGPLQPSYFKRGKAYEEILTSSNNNSSEIILKARTNKESYLHQVKKLREHIQRGNIYEINYCIQFFAENTEIDPWNIFQRLHVLSKAPYSALLKIGPEFVICASPELFLEKKNTVLISKPIKGTIKRGMNKREDQDLKEQLHSSLKDRTENVMAVDVARNDLSMLADRGTVSVNRLYNIESFETVHQMVSTVSCSIDKDTPLNKILDCTFPMASMTGAPKTMAMKLIGESENFDRNFYSGTMGVIDNGDFSLCVIIRSIFYNSETKTVSIAVGGAITYLSDPEKEYEECLLKAKGMMNALNAKIE